MELPKLTDGNCQSDVHSKLPLAAKASGKRGRARASASVSVDWSLRAYVAGGIPGVERWPPLGSRAPSRTRDISGHQGGCGGWSGGVYGNVWVAGGRGKLLHVTPGVIVWLGSHVCSGEHGGQREPQRQSFEDTLG